MNYNTELQGNNTDLQDILDSVNAIPDVGKTILVPTLTNPASAGDLLNGKEMINSVGGVVPGTMKEVTLSTPSIYVNSNGTITASVNVETGKVTGGAKSGTKQLTSADDADFVAANIVEGKTIFGTTGTAEPASALANELSTQNSLITQIMAALTAKGATATSE